MWTEEQIREQWECSCDAYRQEVAKEHPDEVRLVNLKITASVLSIILEEQVPWL